MLGGHSLCYLAFLLNAWSFKIELAKIPIIDHESEPFFLPIQRFTPWRRASSAPVAAEGECEDDTHSHCSRFPSIILGSSCRGLDHGSHNKEDSQEKTENGSCWTSKMKELIVADLLTSRATGA